MDWYVYAAAAALIIVFLLFQSKSSEKRKKENIYRQIKDGFGKRNEREYTHNEFERIRDFFDKKKDVRAIDDITWNDLNMDTVFMLLNNTSSSVGEENLYRMLRNPVADIEILKRRDEVADYFLDNEESAFKLETVYRNIGRTKSISLFDFIHRINELENKSNLRHYIHIIMLIASIVFFAFNPALGIGPVIAVVAINVIMYYRYRAEVENYFVCFNYIVGMLNGAKDICRLKLSGIDDYNRCLDELCTMLTPSFKHAGLLASNALGGSLIDVLLDYVRMITHLDLAVFNMMVTGLKKNIDKIEELYVKLGEIEALYAVASYRKYLENTSGIYCKPGFFDTPGVDGTDIYHPLIQNPVSNSIEAYCGVLLTGSNASGKSTFLKTVAINSIFAQSIYTCTAKDFTTCFCRIYTSMSLRDSIENNESYYMVEIKALKRIMDEMEKGDNVLCFVDEVLRGTNTVERIAASSEIMLSLNRPNVLCFAATHDIELTHILENVYDNYHFREEVVNNDILFNYKLYGGRAATRNAIKLLSIMGYDGKIIKSAESRAIKFLETGKWE